MYHINFLTSHFMNKRIIGGLVVVALMIGGVYSLSKKTSSDSSPPSLEQSTDSARVASASFIEWSDDEEKRF